MRQKFRLTDIKKWIPLPFIGILFCMFFNLLLTLLGVTTTEDAVADSVVYSAFQGNQWLLILIQALVAPILEELIFRKLLQGLFKKWLHYLVAGLITSALFAVGHIDPTQPLWNLAQIIYAFFFGMMLAEITEKNRTWIAAVLTHAVANVFALFMNYSGSLNEFFVNNSIYLTIVSGIGLGLLIFLYEIVCRRSDFIENSETN